MTAKLKFKAQQRVLITSDVHGNLELFKKMLKEMNFTKNDVLIINGDMAEKGPDSIGLFEYIVDLKKDHHVFATLGNCDDLLNLLHDDERNVGMENYMNSRPNTILEEFSKHYQPYRNFQNLKNQAMKDYHEIFSFVGSLPIIIDTPYFTVVHAGMLPEGEQSRTFNLKEPRFLDFNFHFDKPVIVGHYPVCLYNKTYICHNAILNRQKNIYCLDGGNCIKAEGQLNVLEFIGDKATSHSFDLLEYVPAPLTQGRLDGHHLSWDDRDIEIVEIGNEFSLCRHLSSRVLLEIHNSFLDLDYEKLKEDYTDCLVEVREGDMVHIILEASYAYYVKCRGHVGWLLKID